MWVGPAVVKGKSTVLGRSVDGVAGDGSSCVNDDCRRWDETIATGVKRSFP